MKTCYLGIDQGTHVSRAILFDETGRQPDGFSQELAPTLDEGERVEYDPLELLASVRRVVEQAIAAAQVDNRTVAAAGLATQRSTIAAWDAHTGAALAPIISWRDTRGARWLEANVRRHARQIKAVTGLPLTAGGHGEGCRLVSRREAGNVVYGRRGRCHREFSPHSDERLRRRYRAFHKMVGES